MGSVGGVGRRQELTGRLGPGRARKAPTSVSCYLELRRDLHPGGGHRPHEGEQLCCDVHAGASRFLAFADDVRELPHDILQTAGPPRRTAMLWDSPKLTMEKFKVDSTTTAVTFKKLGTIAKVYCPCTGHADSEFAEIWSDLSSLIETPRRLLVAGDFNVEITSKALDALPHLRE